MTGSPQQPLVFYDIASGPPVTGFAPNPWKARYALNFKGAPYRTEWVDLPDVAAVRKSLGLGAVRAHPDGSPHYTLPILRDANTGTLVGDSFDIAVYLDSRYPESPALLPAPGAVGLARAFNAYVDGVFTAATPLFADGMPLNPATAAATRAEFCRRAGVDDWDALTARGEEARAQMLGALEKALEGLAAAYGRTGGAFLEGGGGETPTYADFVVGGWLVTLEVCCAEWEQVRSWQGGVWARLHDALEPYREVK
ncbi:hypothetical protein F5X96DRAFT_257642 [Biscogniauxia mediterranea]|nr:hypothetical protein F5X96DRAFT_257642 [Biscogniauxia mediterranea]